MDVLFIYSGDSERQKEQACVRMPVYSPDACSIGHRAVLQPGAENTIQVFDVGGRSPVT